MKARYTFTLDPSALDAVDHMAEANRRSRSSMIELAIMKEFDRFIAVHEDKLEARNKALAEIKKDTEE